MEYISFLIVLVTLVIPIFLPLIYWYILKRKDSKVYKVCRYLRRFWAVMVVIMVAFKIYQLPQRESYNTYEVIGEFFGQLLMAFLLWKVWKKEELLVENETKLEA